MLWGTFSIIHILSLFIIILIIIGLYYLLKDKDEHFKISVLFCLSLTGIVAIIYNLVKWKSPLEYLPLHLCSLNALCLPIAVATKNKVINNLLLLWSLGALFALIVNHDQGDYEILSWSFILYYFPHLFYLGIPILMFALNLVKKDYKCISSTLLITFISYTVIHFINLLINHVAVLHKIVDWKGEIISVNYMFSITPTNPLLDFLWDIVPYQYWYMLLILPIILIYLLLLYSKQIKKYVFNKSI